MLKKEELLNFKLPEEAEQPLGTLVGGKKKDEEVHIIKTVLFYKLKLLNSNYIKSCNYKKHKNCFIILACFRFVIFWDIQYIKFF